MTRAIVLGAKITLGFIFAISLVGQILIIPLLASDTAQQWPEFAWLQVPGIVVCVALVLCAQVVLVCLWRLLSMVRDEKIFSTQSFRPVNLIIVSFMSFSVLILASLIGVNLAGVSNGGLSGMLIALFVAGIGATLLMIVMRELLRKASTLHHDLAEVI